MELLWPSTESLDSYIAALEQGWSPNTFRPDVSGIQLKAVNANPEAFLESMVDREGKGAPIRGADGVSRARLPGFVKWMWDGEFCGSINLRWQPGTADLPSYVGGHVGYSVVPWKQGNGYASEALRQMLPLAKAEGLPHIDATTEIDNIASQRVLEKNGGSVVKRIRHIDLTTGKLEMFLYRIPLG